MTNVEIMKDRFRFRAWLKNYGAMTPIYQITDNRDIQYVKFNKLENYKGEHPLNNPTFENLEDVVLMQCTGLKDKNGVLIYEGDIVDDFESFHDYELNFVESKDGSGIVEGSGKKVIYEVVYNYAGFYLDPFEKNNKQAPLRGFEEFLKGFDECDTIYDPNNETCKINIKIIGNIHENPELIETIKNDKK